MHRETLRGPRYEVRQGLPLASGCVVVECDCGEKLFLTSSITICSCCEADYAATIRKGLAGKQLKEEALHPWR